MVGITRAVCLEISTSAMAANRHHLEIGLAYGSAISGKPSGGILKLRDFKC